jgi:hypothetical protein
MKPTADARTLRTLGAARPRADVVAVLGAPGCGGDLVTRLLAAAGTSASDHPDVPLAGLADQVLWALQGSRVAPPELPPGWEELPEVVALVPAATEAFDEAVAVTPAEHLVAWFDPAAALLLPFWRSHFGVPRAAVIAWRRPEATVLALAAEGIGSVHAVALWEAYTIHALSSTAGLPVIGLDVDDLLAGSGNATSDLITFIAGLGVEVSADARGRITQLLIDGTTDAPTPIATPEGADQVFARHEAALRAVSGVHASWQPPAGLAVGPWSEALLAAQRAAHRSSAEATVAWLATDEAQVTAQEAQAAAERHIRELVGPDPAPYLELRREIWRVRDEILGLEAERANLEGRLMSVEAAFDEADRRAEVLDEARRQRDDMLRSRQWRVGGILLNPLRRVRDLLRRARHRAS